MNATHNYAIGLVTQFTTISSVYPSNVSDCALNKDISSQTGPANQGLFKKVFVEGLIQNSTVKQTMVNSH